MRKEKRSPATSLLTAFLLLLAMPAVAEDDPDTLYAAAMPVAGTAAPLFTMTDIDGGSFRLDSLKGHYVVIDFWASWCPDCRRDIPNMLRLYGEYHPLGVEFVGVSMDTDSAAWRSAVEKYHIPFIHVSELKKMRDTSIARLYGVDWIPAMTLIAPDGRVILSTVVSARLEKALAALFTAAKTSVP